MKNYVVYKRLIFENLLLELVNEIEIWMIKDEEDIATEFRRTMT